MLLEIRKIIESLNYADLITYGIEFSTILPVVYFFREGLIYITIPVINVGTLSDIRHNNEVSLLIKKADYSIEILSEAQFTEELNNWTEFEEEWMKYDDFANNLKQSNLFIPQFWKRSVITLYPKIISVTQNGNITKYDVEVKK